MTRVDDLRDSEFVPPEPRSTSDVLGAINRIASRFGLMAGHFILIVEAVRCQAGWTPDAFWIIWAAMLISAGLTCLAYGTAWDVARLTWEKRERQASDCSLSSGKSVAGKSPSIN